MNKIREYSARQLFENATHSRHVEDIDFHKTWWP